MVEFSLHSKAFALDKHAATYSEILEVLTILFCDKWSH